MAQPIIHHEPPGLPHRPADGHKGTFGKTLCIGGSRGMGGAIALTGQGALRSGTGLVYLAVPEEIESTVAAMEPSCLTRCMLQDDDGRMSREAHSELSSILGDFTAIAMGPGWGQSPGLADLAKELYLNIQQTLVVDADGLNLLADQPDIWQQSSGERILTPHPGEFARLTNSDTRTIQASRQELACEFAATHNVTLVLKGEGTVITNGRELAINSTGNSGMATGGSGDVLTGILVGLLAQGMTPFPAAHLAVHLHGLAGDLAAAELSEPGLIASDIAAFIPKAWKHLRS